MNEQESEITFNHGCKTIYLVLPYILVMSILNTLYDVFLKKYIIHYINIIGLLLSCSIISIIILGVIVYNKFCIRNQIQIPIPIPI
jgi:hypothetical protein